MAYPNSSVRVRRIAAHQVAGNVPVVNYTDDYLNSIVLDRAVAFDNTERDRSKNTADGTLTMTGVAWSVIGGVAQWA